MESLVRTLYAADGWGVGEVWTRGTSLVHHVLADDDVRRNGPAPGAHDADDLPGVVMPVHPRGNGPRQTAPTSPHASASPATPPPMGGARAPAVTLPGNLSRECRVFVSDLCRRFRAHLAGRRTTYEDVEIELEPSTPFEAALLAALRTVTWGEVVTYGELAALAGRPGAARAAGAFCAAGGHALVLPFHRVVAAGGIGGFGPDGVTVKRRLLALEGVRL